MDVLNKPGELFQPNAYLVAHPVGSRIAKKVGRIILIVARMRGGDIYATGFSEESR